MALNAAKLHFPGKTDPKTSVFARVSAEQAGLKYLNMVAMRLTKGNTFDIHIDQYEYAAVVLCGRCNIRTSRGDFLDVGRRSSVFQGLPYSVYLPRDTDFEIEAVTDDFEMASCWVPTDQDHPIRLIKPEDVSVSLRGKGSTSYQINQVLPEGAGGQRLRVFEMYVPGGNWANYPAQKHDTRAKDDSGQLKETAHEEIGLFRFDRLSGFAMQRIYQDEMEVVVPLQHNDLAVVPEGYHSIVNAPGATLYSLCCLAGESSEYAATTDPAYAWYQAEWAAPDPRLPVVDQGMEAGW